MSPEVRQAEQTAGAREDDLDRIEPVARTAGPSPIGEDDDSEIVWRIPLNQIPSDAWIQAFGHPGDDTSAQHPSHIAFQRHHDRGIFFSSPEKNVRTWLQLIDRWIAAANGVVGLVEEQRQRERAKYESDLRAKAQRLRDADKFKNL